MKFTPVLAAAMAGALVFVASTAFAGGSIENACNRSDRKAANRALCSCIQEVADFALRNGDQRRVASFFKDPDKAQKTKMSQSNADDAFWDRYKAFSQQAEAYCGAS